MQIEDQKAQIKKLRDQRATHIEKIENMECEHATDQNDINKLQD